MDLFAAIETLRADPTNQAVLTALLDFVEAREREYYRPGELYLVPVVDIGMVTKELIEIGERCCARCASVGCPGQLKFRDGTVVCPYAVRVRKAVATDPYVTPLRLVQRLLYRGVQRGTVDLPDGRRITFTIKSASDPRSS